MSYGNDENETVNLIVGSSGKMATYRGHDTYRTARREECCIVVKTPAPIIAK